MSQRENEQDRDAQKREFAKQLLDSYFMFRRNLPEAGFIQENKTTLQIMDELTPMMMHDYSTTTEQDGTVVWAIWRQV